MELYLEDIEMMQGPLHWDLPRGVEAPSSRGRPHGAHRSVGELITIGPSNHADNEQIERVCDTPEQVVELIGEFSNLTLLYINAHSIDAQGRSDAGERGTVSGIRLGGSRIYAEGLPLFEQIRSSFSRFPMTEPLMLGMIHAVHAHVPAMTGGSTSGSAVTPSLLSLPQNSDPLDIPLFSAPGSSSVSVPSPAPLTPPSPMEFTITAEGFNLRSHLFVPRIVMRCCSIGQNQQFCQRLADATETWVFAPTVDQWAHITGTTPWSLHGPVRVFIPACLAHLQASTSRLDLSPFRQRLGQQMIVTRSGRGVRRRPGTIS